MLSAFSCCTHVTFSLIGSSWPRGSEWDARRTRKKRTTRKRCECPYSLYPLPPPPTSHPLLSSPTSHPLLPSPTSHPLLPSSHPPTLSYLPPPPTLSSLPPSYPLLPPTPSYPLLPPTPSYLPPTLLPSPTSHPLLPSPPSHPPTLSYLPPSYLPPTLLPPSHPLLPPSHPLLPPSHPPTSLPPSPTPPTLLPPSHPLPPLPPSYLPPTLLPSPTSHPLLPSPTSHPLLPLFHPPTLLPPSHPLLPPSHPLPPLPPSYLPPSLSHPSFLDLGIAASLLLGLLSFSLIGVGRSCGTSGRKRNDRTPGENGTPGKEREECMLHIVWYNFENIPFLPLPLLPPPPPPPPLLPSFLSCRALLVHLVGMAPMVLLGHLDRWEKEGRRWEHAISLLVSVVVWGCEISLGSHGSYSDLFVWNSVIVARHWLCLGCAGRPGYQRHWWGAGEKRTTWQRREHSSIWY